MRSLIYNIGCLATAQGNEAKSGDTQGEILQLQDAYIVIDDGVISQVGHGDVGENGFDEVWDANGALVTAGLVDAHTHLVFGGWRDNELALKLKGESYLDILNMGGGILYTLEHTRNANEDELYKKTYEALRMMLSLGTTTCEAKSGYCLELEGELKQLRIVQRLNQDQPMDIVSTFMAAHAVPKEYAGLKAQYVDEIVNVMLPRVAKEGLAEYCDVFCETGVFSVEDTRRVLAKAFELGLKLKVHADEIDAIGGSTLAGELKATSAEHLIAIDDDGMNAMVRGGTIAVLLPATSFYLEKGFAPAREMIKRGIPVVIASDFNPGSSPNLSLQFPMNLGCYKYKMTPEEVLCAVTLNAAAAIGRADTVGTLEVGKLADIVIWNAPNLNRVFYRFGHNQTARVFKKGKIVFEQQITSELA